MITKDAVNNAFGTAQPTAGDSTNLRDLINSLFAERDAEINRADAYREVAINHYSVGAAYHNTTAAYEGVDAEAARILEEKGK